MFWWLFLLCPIAYIIGTLNISRIVARCKNVDLKSVGSGNMGSTNIGRSIGFKWFVVVTLLEMLKGVLICFIGFLFYMLYTNGGFVFSFVYSLDCYVIMLSMGLAAMVGCVFPVWTGFKGGKGIASWIGIALFINPLVVLIELIVGIIFLALTRMMSITTLTAVYAWVVASLLLAGIPITATIVSLYIAIALIITYAHRKNLVRLFTGKEKRIVFKKEKK